MSRSDGRNLSLTSLGQRDAEIISSEQLFDGFFPNERTTIRRRSYDGEWSASFTRELFGKCRSVSLLPYDPALDAVLLVEQFRPVPFRHGDRPWMMQTIAGFIDEGETPEQAVRREAIEEAGLAPQHLEAVVSMYLSPGMLLERHWIFATVCDLSTAGGRHGLEQENEDIRAVVADATDCIAGIADGRIRDAMTMVALMWLDRERDRLRST